MEQLISERGRIHRLEKVDEEVSIGQVQIAVLELSLRNYRAPDVEQTATI